MTAGARAQSVRRLSLVAVIAVLLLPVYTRYISPSGYGVVELLANTVIFVNIVVRFGIIEAFLRFYFSDQDPERRAATSSSRTAVSTRPSRPRRIR